MKKTEGIKLNSKLEDVFRMIDVRKQALKKAGLKTVEDLLYYFPGRYGDVSDLKNIKDLQKGDKSIIYAQVNNIKTGKAFIKKMPMTEATLEDATGKIQAVWFRQPYISKLLKEGSFAKLQGTVMERSGKLYLANPEYQSVEKIPLATSDSLFGEKEEEHFIYPVYPETKGLTSKWIFHSVKKILSSEVMNEIEETLPAEILKKYSLPSLKTALFWLHLPKNKNDATVARKRFSFEEIFFIQLLRQKQRATYKKQPSFKIDKTESEVKKFVKTFPFDLTTAQKKSVDQILGDFRNDYPMSRLLEGDVGSGKTAVASTTAFAVVTTKPNGSNVGNLQVAYMAPTEILAKQHFESFIQYFSHFNINIGLITSSGCKKFPSKINPQGWTNISRTQLLKWVANGEIPILIGTHSLIQKSVKFKHLAYVIIDEQHRFGISQRKALTCGKNAELTQNNAESDNFLYRDLTYKIREVLFNVKKELGGGHKEIIYQKAIALELEKMGLSFSREKRIPIKYLGKEVGTYVPDFIVEDKIIIELKALQFVGNSEKKQIWTYLKGSEYKLALLVNYGPRDLTIDRIVFDTARGSLGTKGESASVLHSSASVPHLLSMTATPIPRTLALTIYGDLDLTLLDQMPSGRKPIITEIVTPNKREETYEKIKEEIKAGRQLYVICPRIDDPDPDKEKALNVKSVRSEAARLKKEIFTDCEIDILHGKMTPIEKEEVMKQFEDGEIDILVATSVVEVGVNVPNATMIIIEGGERFGLAQLHQLRGRVIRGNHQAYCFVFSDIKTEQTLKRLNALKTAKNGFELAEYDLSLRGAGELSGKKQWGISDIGMEAIKNIKMVELAREEAKRIIEEDFNLKKYPLIKKRVEELEVHFE